jgi:hypothetical protein
VVSLARLYLPIASLSLKQDVFTNGFVLTE